MALLKKLGGLVIISQLFLSVGNPLVSANVEDSSQEKSSSKTQSLNDNKNLNSSEAFIRGVEESGSANKDNTSFTEDSRTKEVPLKDESTLIDEEEAIRNKNEAFIENGQEGNDTGTAPSDERSTFAAEQQNTGDGTEASPRIVENEEELIQAVVTDKVSYVKLADAPVSAPNQVFDLTKSGRIKIPGDITIDGNGRTVSYTSTRAFEANVAGSYIKFKDITFGSPDFSVPADDYYGFCQVLSKTNVTLEVENVNYYSNKGAQPFYNQNTGGTIVFSGSNNFIVNAGSSSQEFAECSQFLFKKNSQTTVKHNTGQPRAIWATRAFRFELEENAVVDFDTTGSDFVGLPTDGGEVIVGKNADLKITGQADYIYASNTRSFVFNIAEQAETKLSFGKPININANSTFNVGKDATIDFSVTNDSRIFYNRLAPTNFIVDNAYRMSFAVAKASTTALLYTGMTFEKFNPGVTSYGITANNEAINTVIDEGDIIASQGSDLQLSNTITNKTDFTADEKTMIREATRLVFQRLPTPTSIQNVKKVVRDTKAVFNLSEYLTSGNKLTGAVYQLFDTKQDTNNFSTEIKKEEIGLPITSEVTFTDLDSEKNYWLYVQLKAEFSSGDSTWYEVPFKTKSSVMSVTIPVSMFFKTETDEDGSQIIKSPGYGIENNSAYPVSIDLAGFEEKEKSDIQLVDQPDSNNSKGLLLQLTKNHEYLTTLSTGPLNIPISKLDTDENNELRFTGEYYGAAGKEINVKYNMTINFKKAED